MKKAYIAIAVITTLAISAFGQQEKNRSENASQPQKVRSEKSAKGNSTSEITSGESVLQTGTNIEAQLQSMVDVRKSKVGDQVILKTTKTIKQNGEVLVPKGTNLVGRITEVQRKSKENATSRVGMVFDRIQGKRLDTPINLSIVSVAAARAGATAGDLFAGDVSGSSSTSGSASSGRSGGGLLGGVGSTVGGVVNTTTQTVGNVAGTATNTVSQTAGTLGNTVNGLQISNSVSGSASSSSTISAQGKDVRIDKGATFNLRVDGSTQN